MKFINKMDKISEKNDGDTTQLYKHGEVHIMVIGKHNNGQNKHCDGPQQSTIMKSQ